MRSSAVPRTPLPSSLRVFVSLFVLLDLVCVGFELFDFFVGHRGYPRNWPFLPFFQFTDFWRFLPRFQHFHSPAFFSAGYEFAFMYPAPVALIYKAFYVVPAPHITFVVVTTALLLALAALLARAMVRLGVSPVTTVLFLAVTLLLSYPFWFEYLLGNMEIWVFLITAFGLLLFLQGRTYAAAVLIGVAISLKIFPLVYLGLFFSRRKCREFWVSVLTVVGVNVAALWLVCPAIKVSINGIRAGLAEFRVEYIRPYLPVETSFDHSIFGFIKSLLRSRFHENMPDSLAQGYLLTAALVGLLLYFLVIRHLPMLNQIVALSVASILLPPTSHDYTLMEIYFGWGLVSIYAIQCLRRRIEPRGVLAALVCFAVLFSAQSEVIFHGSGRSGQIKMVALIVLLLLSLSTRWEASDRELLGLQELAPGDSASPIPLTPERLAVIR